MNTYLAVVDEPVELCVTRLRYAQIHGFWRLVVKLSALGKEPWPLIGFCQISRQQG
jgi:hypothetical protein